MTEQKPAGTEMYRLAQRMAHADADARRAFRRFLAGLITDHEIVPVFKRQVVRMLQGSRLSATLRRDLNAWAVMHGTRIHGREKAAEPMVERITIRLTGDQKGRLEVAAKRRGVTAGDYIREAVLAQLSQDFGNLAT